MRPPTYRDAIRRALHDELETDPKVLLFGEDVAVAGGVFQVTRGLAQDFGPRRVFDVPISELALASAAFGVAVGGYRPVIEIMFGDFAMLAADSIVNQTAKWAYWAGREHGLPVTVRLTTGAGMRFGAIHSQNPAHLFLSVPGMTVVAPSSAEDAYALLRSSVRHDGPTVFLEHKGLYSRRADRALGEAEVPLGSARVARPGSAVTVVSVMRGVHLALEAADDMAAGGVDVEVVDLRCLRPMDVETVVDSVSRTRRLLVLDEQPSFGGWGAELAATVAERCPEVRVARLGALDQPLPFSPVLEDAVLPTTGAVVGAVDALLHGSLDGPVSVAS